MLVLTLVVPIEFSIFELNSPSSKMDFEKLVFLIFNSKTDLLKAGLKMQWCSLHKSSNRLWTHDDLI